MNACFLIILIFLHYAHKASCCGVPDAQFLIKKPDKPGHRNAQRKRNLRTWGGEANPHSLPWQVYLDIDEILPNGTKNSFLCGGSIISPHWVVTANHCTKNSIVSKVVAGAHNYLGEDPENRQVRKNAKKIEHPLFNTTEFLHNDIALLQLDEPFEFNSFVQPVCVTYQAPSEDSICLTSGWGMSGTLPDTLEQVYMDIVDPSLCARYGFFDQETKICAWDTDRGNIKPCSGDSGGPLVCKSNTEKEWSLIGVISYGVQCELKLPMAFTKVSTYFNWIEEQLSNGKVSNRRYEGELGEIEGQENEGMVGQEGEGKKGQENEGMEGHEGDGKKGQEHKEINGKQHKGKKGQEHKEMEAEEHEGMDDRDRGGIKRQEHERQWKKKNVKNGKKKNVKEWKKKNVKEWNYNEHGRKEGRVKTAEASLPSADMAVENRRNPQSSSSKTSIIAAAGTAVGVVLVLLVVALAVSVAMRTRSRKHSDQDNVVNNNNNAVLFGTIIHRPDAPLASQERKDSENC